MASGLPQLVFSTRSRHPTGGADAVREVIAASPNVPDAARGEFAARADLGGTLLHAELEGPVYTFSPIDEGSWLFCRATSLGRYRKGAHQFLVHGVVLGLEHLAAVEGNPLLLDRPGSGLDLLAEHPGAGAALGPLAFPSIAAGAAAAANRRRFDELAASLGGDDDWFPAAWGALGRGERVALVDPRPRADLAEWLLLHLHPDDRPHVGFHTWYSHGRPLAYRLLLTAPEEAARVRGQFRGVRLIERAAPPRGGETGELARRLRRRDPERFRRVLAEVHLTRLATRPLPPLDEDDAALALAAATDGEAALTEAGRGRLALLRLRSQPAAVLRYAIGDLAAAWRRGPRDFVRALGPLAESIELDATAVAAVAAALARQPADDAAERWSLLALLDAADRRHPERSLAGERVPTWRALVPHGGFDDLVGGFDAARGEAAEAVLAELVLASDGAGLADGSTADPAAADWPRLVAWLVARGRPHAAVADRVERLAREAPPPADRLWLRRLGELWSRAGDDQAALRLWLDEEAPLLAGDVRRRRVEAVVGWALRRGVDGLESRLDHPRLGDAVPAALGAWAAAEPDPERAWQRLDALVGRWRLDETAAPAVGALLARLAASSLAERVPQLIATLVRPLDPVVLGRLLGAALAEAARRLAPVAAGAREPAELARTVAGVTELLQVRTGHPGAAAADAALLELSLPALVAAQELAAAGERTLAERFRTAWTALLRAVRSQRVDGRSPLAELDALLEEDWIDLLFDDFARRPLTAPQDDLRYSFLLDLAWRAWASDPSTRRLLRAHRSLQLVARPPTRDAERRPADPGAAWLRERIAAAVPPDRRREAWAVAGLRRDGTGDNLPAR